MAHRAFVNPVTGARHCPPRQQLQDKLKDPGNMSVKELRGAIAWAGLGRMAVGLAEKLEFVGLEETRLELVLGKRD